MGKTWVKMAVLGSIGRPHLASTPETEFNMDEEDFPRFGRTLQKAWQRRFQRGPLLLDAGTSCNEWDGWSAATGLAGSTTRAPQPPKTSVMGNGNISLHLSCSSSWTAVVKVGAVTACFGVEPKHVQSTTTNPGCAHQCWSLSTTNAGIAGCAGGSQVGTIISGCGREHTREKFSRE